MNKKLYSSLEKCFDEISIRIELLIRNVRTYRCFKYVEFLFLLTDRLDVFLEICKVNFNIKYIIIPIQ